MGFMTVSLKTVQNSYYSMNYLFTKAKIIENNGKTYITITTWQMLSKKSTKVTTMT